MKKSHFIGPFILIAAAAFLLRSIFVFAEGGAPPPGEMLGQSRNFDWVQHTQRTMDELKVKLNLTSGQMAAWDNWSRGVIKDARQQVEQNKTRHKEKSVKAKPAVADTTPERMSRGIERLRARTIWMQAHLVELDAALVRTKTFYNALDTNQKTIFDLFWHEIYHRVSGHDDDWSMHENEGSYPDAVMGEFDNAANGY
jgi:hypothetical protein